MKLNQHDLNQAIEKFIKNKDLQKEVYSQADVEYISKYEGSGGQGSKGATGEGLLYEFYTPAYIVELMWKLAVKHGYDGGPILEPGIGTGRMIEPAPDKSKVTGFEINPVSARIAEITYPEATIHKGYFETAFLEKPRFTTRIKKDVTGLKDYPFSLVIGNPPFGVYKNKYSSYFPNPNLKQIELFFMYYGLKLLKKDGLLIYITGSNFLRNGDTYNSAKIELGKLAELIDAYRLPSIFKASKVGTDIIVLRKK